MKKAGLVLMMLVIIVGCAGTKLAMMEAKNDPAKVSPGDMMTVSVRIVDSKGVVESVTATVREAQEIRLYLNDKGEDGDETAGDGVWTFGMEVPYEAQPGVYHWDIEAFDANSRPVKVTIKGGGEDTLTAEVAVEVLY
jgi:hypothetical protein